MPVVDRQRCAGGIVFDDARRILLVQRAKAPAAGNWSIPGGRCRPAESAGDACVRELREETGLEVTVVRWAGRVQRDAPDGSVYLIDDFVCTVVAGSLRAGDDALDARWFRQRDLDDIVLAPGVRSALADWGLLPAR